MPPRSLFIAGMKQTTATVAVAQSGRTSRQRTVHPVASISQTKVPVLLTPTAGVTVADYLASAKYKPGAYVSSNGNAVTIVPALRIGSTSLASDRVLAAGEVVHVRETVSAAGVADLIRDSATVTVAEPVAGATHTASMHAMEVAELAPDISGATITRITQQPTRGWATPRDDGKISVVMTRDTSKAAGSDMLRFEVDDAGTLSEHEYDLTIIGLPAHLGPDPNPVPGAATTAWPVRRRFYPEVDPVTDRAVFDPGPGHVAIHATIDAAGWTRAEIEAQESLGAGGATNAWLDGQTHYGSEAAPLEASVAVSYWDYRTSGKSSSTWLLFQRGVGDNDYTPFKTGYWVHDTSRGLSPLHPLLIGSYGTGTLPFIGSAMHNNDEDGPHHVVFRDVRIDNYGRSIGGRQTGIFSRIYNHLLEGVLCEEMVDASGNPEGILGLTIRCSAFYDTYSVTQNGAPVTNWGNDGKPTRANPLHPFRTEGLVVERCFIDVAGWQPGWHYDGVGGKDPPEVFSHTNYSDEDSWDSLYSEVVASRGAFAGFNLRGGGTVQYCISFDCNVGLSHGNGSSIYANQPRLAVHRLLVTSAGWRCYQDKNQIVCSGLYTEGNALKPTFDQSLVINYRNEAEGVEPVREGMVSGGEPRHKVKDWHPWYDSGVERSRIRRGMRPSSGIDGLTDVAVHNWFGDGVAGNEITGVAAATLDATTMQTYVGEQTAQTGLTVLDVCAYFRAHGAIWEDVRGILDWFYGRAGLPLIPTGPGTMHYRASSKGNGLRMDEAWNWSGDRLLHPGDVAHLHGHKEVWTGRNARCDTLHLEGAHVYAESLLEPLTAITGPGAITLIVNGAGQVRLPAYAGAELITVAVEGGRFLSAGAQTGSIDLTASGGETVLATPAAPWTQKAGSTLRIVGADLTGTNGSGIGCDGQGAGSAAITFEAGSTLRFDAGATGVSAIREFQSGRFGNATPNVASSVDLGGANLTLDLTGLPGGWTGTLTLIDVDSVTGTFDANVSVIAPGGHTAGAPQISGGQVTVAVS